MRSIITDNQLYEFQETESFSFMVRLIYLFSLFASVEFQRASFICAHAWISFKLYMFITIYMQAMKIYLFNKITKTRTQEATLTYSHYEVIPVSTYVCPKFLVSFISNMFPLDSIQNTLGISAIPQNHLN